MAPVIGQSGKGTGSTLQMTVDKQNGNCRVSTHLPNKLTVISEKFCFFNVATTASESNHKQRDKNQKSRTAALLHSPGICFHTMHAREDASDLLSLAVLCTDGLLMNSANLVSVCIKPCFKTGQVMSIPMQGYHCQWRDTTKIVG